MLNVLGGNWDPGQPLACMPHLHVRVLQAVGNRVCWLQMPRHDELMFCKTTILGAGAECMSLLTTVERAAASCSPQLNSVEG